MTSLDAQCASSCGRFASWGFFRSRLDSRCSIDDAFEIGYMPAPPHPFPRQGILVRMRVVVALAILLVAVFVQPNQASLRKRTYQNELDASSTTRCSGTCSNKCGYFLCSCSACEAASNRFSQSLSCQTHNDKCCSVRSVMLPRFPHCRPPNVLRCCRVNRITVISLATQ